MKRCCETSHASKAVKRQRWQQRKRYLETLPIFSLLVTIEERTKKWESLSRSPWQGPWVRRGHESSSCSNTDTGRERCRPATSSAWHFFYWSSPVATMCQRISTPNLSKEKVSFTSFRTVVRSLNSCSQIYICKKKIIIHRFVYIFKYTYTWLTLKKYKKGIKHTLFFNYIRKYI